MIVYLITEKLPRFFRFIYRLICESAVFRGLAAAWHWLCDTAKGSILLGWLFERPGEAEKTKNSAVIRFADAVSGCVTRFVRTVADKLTFGSFSCVFTRLLGKLKELYSFLDYEFFCGACIFFIIVCPGERWSNLFGLGIALVLLFVLIVMIAAGKRDRVSLACVGASFFAFVISTVLGIVIASDVKDALRVSIFFATSFILVIVIAATAQSKAKLKKLLGFIYAAAIVSALYAFYQRATGVNVSASFTDLSLNASMPGRVFSSFENPNNYAELLILILPLCVAYCSMLKRSAAAAVCWVLNALPAAALLMTYSRSGWVSFAIAVLVFVFLYNKKLLPALALAALLLIPFLPSSVTDRISTIGSTDDSSNMYRIYIWEGALKMLRDCWFTGLGLGPSNFREVYITVYNPLAGVAQHAHMLYLEIWLEQGIVGLVCYLSMLFSAVRRSVIAAKYAEKGVRLTLIAGVSSIVGIMFSSAVEYIWYYPRVMVVYFMVLGIMYACVNIVNSGRAESEPLIG